MKWMNEEFINGAYEGLKIQTEAHKKTWNLGEEKSWNVDMKLGLLSFQFLNDKVANANIQVVGTYNSDDSSFLWGWEHPSVPKNLAEYAEKAKTWGNKHAEILFTKSKINCNKEDVWKIAAVVNRINEGNGVYCGNSGSTMVFMILKTINLKQENK